MKVAVVGLWHLGAVTAACMAHLGFDVVGFDEDLKTITDFKQGIPPILEPNLETFVREGLLKGNLKFSAQPSDISEADIVWITYDTPVDANDNADVDSVRNKIIALFPLMKADAIVLISSQLPLGSTSYLQKLYDEAYPNKPVCFACSPENLRLGKATDVFLQPDRIIVGLNNLAEKPKLESVLQKISPHIVWMSIESAEMTKHAINAFLATSVVFINEIAVLCESMGADAREVEKGLKSELRIGPKAYLHPGPAFAGGTLARDLNYLIDLGQQSKRTMPLFSAALESNKTHRSWASQKLHSVLGDLKNKKIAILGLTYKPGTDTLRRSTAIETAEWLHAQGVIVTAYDPVIRSLPEEYQKVIALKSSANAALQNTDAVVIATEWPEFKALSASDFQTMQSNLVIDVGGFLYQELSDNKNINYMTVGRGTHETTK
jgi:UDPglucose 6-dehydrogenase